eukprot:TRINITY_DN28349_c0_g1_i1.p1 TRINITY_DN28349_c0_g1~~TRINITY_DN28349_c0_g1_i1.p1  ORF type:complete len:231 (+),score=90.23 TRINITY_DN28349_c0_g1_i1:64-756(+)
MCIRDRYCKDTLSGLSESVVQCVESMYHERIDFGPEEETFNAFINKSFEVIWNNIDAKLENLFAFLWKTNWERFEKKTGEASQFVKDTQVILSGHLKNMKPLLSDVFFNFFLNKLAGIINTKYIKCILLNKKLPDVDQVYFDFTEMRNAYVQYLKNDSEKISSTTINYTDKIMGKTQKLLKILMMSNDQIIMYFKDLYEGGTSPQDLEKLLALKGIKRTDIPSWNEAVNR